METNNNNVPAEQKAQNGNGTVQKFSEDTVGSVLQRIATFQTNGDLKLPPDYNAENAIRSAWLLLQETVDLNRAPVLQSCSKESIANALLNMVVQGLNPVKKQCYFIPYGGKLLLQKSYMGTIAVAKRVGDVKDIVANVIYNDDVFQYEIDPENGRKKVIKHEQKLENIDVNKIKGFYAIVLKNDGTLYTEVMTMAQVQSSWAMGSAKGNSPAHKTFQDQMGMKTVVNRALKVVIGASDDSSLYEDEEPTESVFTANVKEEIKNNANRDIIGFEEKPEGGEQKNENGNGTEKMPDIKIEQPVEGQLTEKKQEEPQGTKAPF